jgi:starch synthase
MNVLFVSPEVNPLIRTGGLGDVVGSLPLALKQMGIDVRVICPFHRECKTLDTQILRKSFEIKLEDQILIGKCRQTTLGSSDVPAYLIDLPKLFDRDGVYSDQLGDFQDNAQRAFALSQAATQLQSITDWQPDIIHAHDWMAAPVCAYVNASNLSSPQKDPKVRTVLTIHNLQHQGIFSYEDFLSSGLPLSNWAMDGMEKEGALNLLKGGIQHANKITTVSPTYASEIRTTEYGCGLEKSLEYRGADLVGILNGIDESSWNPQKDQTLPSTISTTRPKTGKQACKDTLLKELNMQPQHESPLFGVVSRLYEQKGLDLLIEILPQLMAETHACFAILGSGDSKEEQAIRDLSISFPDRIGSLIGFDDGLARRIFAGSDFFIMPSRFEPCGLAQQYAMRYGSLPIARKTGGLADTIIPVSRGEKKANGFLFDNATAKELWITVKHALEVYANNRKFTQMRKNAMNRDCGWARAAEQYIEVYKWAKECS